MTVPLVRESTSTGSDPANSRDKCIGADGGSSPPERTAGRSQSSSRSKKQRDLIPTVIIDKNALFRAGLVHILGGSRFRVTASRSSLSDLSERVLGDKHCVVLISVDREVGTILPQVASLTEQGRRVVVLTEKFHPEELVAAIEAGAAGYLLKNEITPDMLVKSMELVSLGGVVIPQGFAKPVMDRVQRQSNAFPVVQDPESVLQGGLAQPASGAAQADHLRRLSNRELMILEGLMQGASNKHIARAFNIAEATVKVCVRSLLRKIRVHNRTQAAIWGRDRVTPNGQPKLPPVSSPTGGDSDTTLGTMPN
jgi:two-component system nitrate/nitrite response regulator NarL